MKAARHILLALLCCFALVSAQAEEKLPREIEALQKKMYLYYSQTNHERFIEVTDSLMAAAEKAGQERIFYKAWSNKAIYTYTKISRTEGLSLIRQMKSYAQQNESDYGLFAATYAAGTMQSGMDLYDEAEKSFLEAINYGHTYFPDESMAASYLGLAKIELTRKHFQKVLEYTQKALKEPSIIMQHQLSAWSYRCLALFETGDLDKFHDFYLQREKVKQAYGQDDNYGEFIELYHAEMHGDYQKALDIARNLKSDVNRMSMTARELANLGDYKAAYEESDRLKRYRDTSNIATIRKLASQFAVEMDVARAENEAKDSRLEAQLHAERAQRIMLAFIIVAALLTITFLGILIHRQRRHERYLEASNQKLKEANEKLTAAYSELEETTKAKERHESELRIANDIQRSMIPMKFPAFPDYDEIDLYAFIQAARGVGGDLYDYSILGDKLYFCLGDVAGKGMPAALFMVGVISMFRTEVKEGVMPEHIADKMNSALSADNDNSMFVTMFIGMLDLKTGRLDYCNCGHNPPVLLPHITHEGVACDGHFIDTESNGPIGLWPDLTYTGQHIEDMTDQTLFIYSDGLNEAENQEQVQFGDNRVLDTLNKCDSASSQQIITRVQEALNAFVGDAEQSDDLTMLCIRLKQR